MEIIENFKGEFYTDHAVRSIYSTDASEYKELPIAVAIPKNEDDVKVLIEYARHKGLSLIPRGAGTSLAGQTVGKGIVVDVSKYMDKILEINTKERWVRVQPGIVLKELNILLEKYGLMFGPETSSATRCTLGGMVGNNAAGLHSLKYGSTRDHILEISGFLYDGSFVKFTSLNEKQYKEKMKRQDTEGRIYRQMYELLSDEKHQKIIENNYPDKTVKRRNTGYALDLLLESEIFGKTGSFNFSKLLAGSEGTLMFFTELKLNLVELPPRYRAVVAVHLKELHQAFEANLIALKYSPSAVELIDNTIIELASRNKEQKANKFFVKGNPGALLIVEFNANSREEIEAIAADMIAQMRSNGYGYYFPLIWGKDIDRVWAFRNAGLGLLPNLYGEAKPVGVIEDTAVDVQKLGSYIAEFDKILRKYNLWSVYYAHIGSGELHLRPVLNLRNPEHLSKFRKIAEEVALLVKKYRGSLSGEHGDGRLRGEFIPVVLGNEVYDLLKKVKQIWDPINIFNPGKIVDTPPMDTSLRLMPGMTIFQPKTYYSFDRQGGFTKAVLKCNGSADCRKKQIIGGTMCPSYKATTDERFSTRARANLLREILIEAKKPSDFTKQELYQILDTCLSCKACKSECPSNVDMAKFKAEFLQHYYDENGIPLRVKIIAHLPYINKFLMLFPKFANYAVKTKIAKKILDKLGFAPQRNFPLLAKKSLNRWFAKHLPKQGKQIYLFNDEFTNQYDTDIGIKTILLLEHLGYSVKIPKLDVSGRTYLSKGLIKKATKIINRNIAKLSTLINNDTPLVGIEPSAILTFRDEALDLAYPNMKEAAERIAQNTYTLEEFLAKEIDNGNIKSEQFTQEPLHIKLHTHCFQKALSSSEYTKKILSLPVNYTVELIRSGCCGMAGAFGYEKEHYELSMKIGELVLFPEVRSANKDTIIAAPGTSCRHHIEHGTGRKAMHPAEILYHALKK